MPNWCANMMVVGHANEKMMRRFLRGYERGRLGQEFLPMPQEYLQDGRWYDWRVSNWGTKWDFGQGDVGVPAIERGGRLEVRFDTAWCPPFEFYLEMRRLGFDIDVSFYESGIELCGRVLNDAVELFAIDCWKPDCVRRFIDSDLVELFGIDGEGGLYDEESSVCSHGDQPWVEMCSLQKIVASNRAAIKKTWQGFG